MTLTELCNTLHYSENTFKRSFKRTCESLQKKGIVVIKNGYGDTADYTIIYDDALKIPKKSQKIEHTDLIGQRFGHLTVLKDSGERFHRGVVWQCKCDCGNIKNIPAARLKNGHAKSCGNDNCIYHSYYNDLTGQRFGKLIALSPTTMKDNSHMYWKCQCDCGKIVEVASNHLLRQDIQSCGCILSIGEQNIEKVLIDNNIEYKKQISFPDLKNINKLRYDFGIFSNNTLIRLIEFDGIQHFKEQNYFSHSLQETKHNDQLKDNYAKEHNIPLVRIPYYERDKINLELIIGDKYLI